MTNGGHHTRDIRLTAERGVEIGCSWWRASGLVDRPCIVSVVTANTIGAHFQFDISASEARALAANLLAHADEVEAAEREVDVVAIAARRTGCAEGAEAA